MLLIFSAIAVPSIWKTYADFKLLGMANDVAGMMQRTRSAAVRENSPAYLNYTSSPNQMVVALSNSYASLGGMEKEIVTLPSTMSFATAVGGTGQPAALTYSNLGAVSTTTMNVANASNPVYFNARGIPCPYNSTTGTCPTPSPSTAYVYYLTDGSSWMAVSANPAGRVKEWIWNASGGAWIAMNGPAN
jgi:Tfp pilus assembly protein FimT